MIADGYICVTIDPETVCHKCESYLKKSLRNSEKFKVALTELDSWCKMAKAGDHIIRDEFTIIVKRREQKML